MEYMVDVDLVHVMLMGQEFIYFIKPEIHFL